MHSCALFLRFKASGPCGSRPTPDSISQLAVGCCHLAPACIAMWPKHRTHHPRANTRSCRWNRVASILLRHEKLGWIAWVNIGCLEHGLHLNITVDRDVRRHCILGHALAHLGQEAEEKRKECAYATIVE